MKINVINMNKSNDAQSKAISLTQKAKKEIFEDDRILTPFYTNGEPYMFMEETELFGQCIEAITQSAFGHGYIFTKQNEEVKNDDLRAIIENISPSEIFTEVIKRWASQTILYGYSAIEIMLSNDGKTFEFANIPVQDLRITLPDEIPTEYAINGESRHYRFRRYVQVVSDNIIYFKELHDPRVIDYKTGNITTQADQSANPVLWLDNGNYTTHAYPVPTWQGSGYQALSLAQVHKLNYNHFHNGRIQTKILLVSGSEYTQEEMEAIHTQISESKGVENAGQIIIVQAPPSQIDVDSGMDTKLSKVDMDLVNLVDNQDKDPQFLEFIKDCREGVMSAFRVPPIVLGLSNDYNKATSEDAINTFLKMVVMPLQEKVENKLNQLLSYCGYNEKIEFRNPIRRPVQDDRDTTKN